MEELARSQWFDLGPGFCLFFHRVPLRGSMEKKVLLYQLPQQCGYEALHDL
jgi:hypothetical protein